MIFLTNFSSSLSSTSGTIISGLTNLFVLLETFIAALIIALVCITQISG